MSRSHLVFGWCLLIGLITRNTNASVGDRSPYYRACVEKFWQPTARTVKYSFLSPFTVKVVCQSQSKSTLGGVCATSIAIHEKNAASLKPLLLLHCICILF